MDQIPWIRGDPRDPGMESFLRVLGAPASKNEQDVALALCFFDFFRDVSCETIGFSTIFGQAPSRNGSKTYGLAWDVMKKVEKTSGDSSGGTGRLWRSGPGLGGSGRALGGPGTVGL